MKIKFAKVTGLLLLTVVVFWQVTGHEFIIFDDPEYVFNNIHVTTGITLSNLRWAFNSYLINWHPLTWISHMVDVQIFGLVSRYHHLINLLIHVINTALLFSVLYLMTNEFDKSLFVASLFAIHPLHVESVAWVAERKDVLSTLFGLLTVLAYVKYVSLSSLRYYLLMCILFACCLMAKPMLVTLPVILLLFDFWPLNRMSEQRVTMVSFSTKFNSYTSMFKLILEKLPLVILAIGSSIITIIAQKEGGAVASLDVVPLSLRSANAIISYFKYLQKMVWPTELSIIYPLQQNISTYEVIIALITCSAMCCVVLYYRKKFLYLPVGWFFFVISMIPVIGLVQVGSQAMADRYTYMPYTGLFMMITWGFVDFTAHWKRQRVVLAATATIVIASLSIVTWKRVGDWQNSITIFSQAASVVGNFYLVQNQLGVALSENNSIEAAIDHLESAIRDKPNFAQAHYNLGNAFEKSGDTLKAVESFSMAILYKPEFIDAYFNRAILYARLGKFRYALSDLLKVMDSTNMPSNINHCTPEETFNLLGKTYSDLGDHMNAIHYTSRAIAYNPNYRGAYLNRGFAYKATGSMAAAKVDFLNACQQGSQQGCDELEKMGSLGR